MIPASGEGTSHNNALKTRAGRLSKLPKGGKNLGKILSPACLPTTSALVTCLGQKGHQHRIVCLGESQNLRKYQLRERVALKHIAGSRVHPRMCTDILALAPGGGSIQPVPVQ